MQRDYVKRIAIRQKYNLYTNLFTRFAVPLCTTTGRDLSGIPEKLPFHGWDIWNGYELWSNEKGKPQIALAVEFYFPLLYAKPDPNLNPLSCT